MATLTIELTDDDQRFIELWNSGKTAAEIGATLGLSRGHCQVMRYRLADALNDRKRGVQRAIGFCATCGKEIRAWHFYCSRKCMPSQQKRPADDRDRELLAMTQTGNFTLKHLGEHFGITRERVRQLLKRLGEKTQYVRKPQPRQQKTKLCAMCGTAFPVKNKRKYCSTACRNAATRTPDSPSSRYRQTEEKTCDNCGKKFRRSGQQQAMHEREQCKHDFCSRACYFHHGHTQITAFGETKGIARWLRDPRCVDISFTAFRYRLDKLGMSAEAALTTPKKRTRKDA